MDINQTTTTVTKIKLREKELHLIIVDYLKANNIENTDKSVVIDFKKEAFSTQSDGLNAYDEYVTNITITKTSH